MKRRSLAVLVAMVLVMPACSGGAPPAAGDRTRLGGDSEEPNSKKKKEARKKAAQIGEKAEASGEGGGTGEGASAKVAGEPPDSATVSSDINPAFARRSSIVDDSASDSKREGVTPSYAEATRASIIGLGEDFKLTLTFEGDLPSAMPNDKTHMIVAFGITGSNEEEGYSFGAQCTPDGWQAYAGGKDDTSEFPGTLEVSGNKIEMVVPWDYIRGPRAFEWYAASNWFSQVANVTNYRVDLVPNEGLSKFPK